MSLARMAEPATTPRYERHRPEQTLLYQLVATHYPAFCAQLDAQGRRLPAYVRQEFEDFLRCSRLEHGFLRVRCEDCKHERLVAFSCKRRGFWYLEKEGWLQRDVENTYLHLLLESDDDDALLRLLGYSVTYRIAFGPQAGRKVLSLQSLPPAQESARVAKQAGFSLHAGVMADSHQNELRERLCRYISRPAVSEKRLALTNNGKVRYELKTPYRDGTTHVFFDRGGLPPLDFIARLAALIPKPRVNLTRFHGLFAPNSKHRALVTPGKRGKGRKLAKVECAQEKTLEERRKAMTCTQRASRNAAAQACLQH